MQEFHVETIESSDGCAVLRVAGEVDVFTAPKVREGLHYLAAAGAVHLIVDMGGVVFLDSTGLGALVGGLKRVRAQDGTLVVVIKADHVRRVFEITGLTKVFPLFTSTLDAITADANWEQMANNEAGSPEQWCRRHGLSGPNES